MKLADPTPSSPVIPAPATLELVEDAVVFIERAQLTPEVFMNLWRQEKTVKLAWFSAFFTQSVLNKILIDIIVF